VLRGSVFYSHQQYSLIQYSEIGTQEIDVEMDEMKPQTLDIQQKARMPFCQIWSFNVMTTLSAQAIFDFHMG
jgi:hypothetical protein